MEIMIIKIVLGLGYMGLEYWLGKTDKVKAGSVIEAAMNITKLVVNKSLK